MQGRRLDTQKVGLGMGSLITCIPQNCIQPIDFSNMSRNGETAFLPLTEEDVLLPHQITDQAHTDSFHRCLSDTHANAR